MPKDQISYNEVLDPETLIPDAERIWLGIEIESNSNAQWTPKRTNFATIVATIEQLIPAFNGLTKDEADDLYYPLNDNPAGYLTEVPDHPVAIRSDDIEVTEDPADDFYLELKTLHEGGIWNTISVNPKGLVVGGGYVNYLVASNLKMVNGLTYNTSSVTGKLGGKLIENTTILTDTYSYLLTGDGTIRHTSGNATNYLHPSGYGYITSTSGDIVNQLLVDTTYALIKSDNASFSTYLKVDTGGIGELRAQLNDMYHNITVQANLIKFGKDDNSVLNINALGLPPGTQDDSIMIVDVNGAIRTISYDDFILGIDTDTNNYPTNLVFNPANGNLTLSILGMADLVTSIDGRYLQSFTETDPIANAKVITLNQGSGITITGTAGQTLGSNPVWSIAHADTSSVTNIDTSAAQVIDVITFDTYGHIQTVTTRNMTASDLGIFDRHVVSAAFTGTTTKTLTLNFNDSSTAVVASFTDIDTNKYVTNIAVTGTNTKTVTLTFNDSTTISTSFTDMVGEVTESDGNDYTISGTFNTSTGNLVYTRTDSGTYTVNLDGRYLQSFTETDPVALAKTISIIQGAGMVVTGTATQALSVNPSWTIAHADTSSVTNLDTSGAQVIDTLTFDTYGHVQTVTTRNLTLADLGYVDRYVSSAAFSGTSTKTLTLSFSNGAPDVTASFTDIDTDINYYTVSGTFNAGNGNLVYTRTDGGTYTVNLDGRYLTDKTITINAGQGVSIAGSYTQAVSTNPVWTISIGDYIWNQFTATQNAVLSPSSYWISGRGRIDTSFQVNDTSSSPGSRVSVLNIDNSAYSHAGSFSNTGPISNSYQQGGIVGAMNFNNSSSFTQSVNYAAYGLYGQLKYNTTAPVVLYNSGGSVSFHAGVLGLLMFQQATGNDISGSIPAAFRSVNYFGGGGGNIQHAAAFNAGAPRQFPGVSTYTGTVTNYYGLYVADFSTSDISSGSFTNLYAIYQAGVNDNNYFGGNVYFDKVKGGSTQMLVVTSTGLVQAQAISSGADGNNYPTGVSFNTSNGFLSISRNGLSDISGSLDGRYLTGITSSQVTTALGYTPYNGATNPNGYISSYLNYYTTSASWSSGNGYITFTRTDGGTYNVNIDGRYLTGITSSQVTTALGYTPYNGATNPNGYISSYQNYYATSVSQSTNGTISIVVSGYGTINSSAASGTWGIDISGTATYSTYARYIYNDGTYGGTTGYVNASTGLYVYYAANAGSVPWSGVTGAPSFSDTNYYPTSVSQSSDGTISIGVTGYGTIYSASASGTWGINITGQANTIVSQANSATITASMSATASTIAQRNGSGYLFATYFNTTASTSETTTPTHLFGGYGGDGYIRGFASSAVRTYLGSGTQNSTTFLRGDGTWANPGSGVTINNNAYYRVITGDSAANTLNAETYFTWDGQYMNVSTVETDVMIAINAPASFTSNLRLTYNSVAAYQQFSYNGTSMKIITHTTSDGSNDRYTFHNNGNFTAAGNITATTFFKSSDMRDKQLIKNRPVFKGLNSLVDRLYLKNGVEEVGYYAQDIQKIMPFAVSIREDGRLDVDYVQVLVAEVAALRREIKQLKAKK